MKHLQNLLAIPLLALCAGFAAAADHEWRADLAEDSVHNIYLRHGDATTLRAELYVRGRAYAPSVAVAKYRTNLVDQTWLQAPAFVASNAVSFSWTPFLAPGADIVPFVFQIDGEVYRAPAMIYLRASPDADSDEARAVLDLDAYDVQNAPWLLAETDPAFATWIRTNSVRSAVAAELAAASKAATNYTDQAIADALGSIDIPEGADMTSVSNAVSDLMVAAVAENPVESTLEVLRMAVAELWESHDKLAGLEAYDDIADAIDAMVHGPLTNYPPRTEVAQNLTGYVPTSRTVNNKALSANVTLSASDVGALPVSGYSAISPADIGSDPYIYVEFYGSTRILSYTGTGTLEVGGLYAPNGPPCHLVLSGFSSVSWPNGWYPIIDGTYDSSGANYYEVGSVNGQSYVRFLFSFPAP